MDGGSSLIILGSAIWDTLAGTDSFVPQTYLSKGDIQADVELDPAIQ